MPVTYDLITRTALTSDQSNVTFSSISSNYDILVVTWTGQGAGTISTADAVQLRYNNDSNTFYSQHRIYDDPYTSFGGDSGLNENAQNLNTIPSQGNGTTLPTRTVESIGGGRVTFYNPNSSIQVKKGMVEGNANFEYSFYNWLNYTGTSAVTSLVFLCNLAVPGQFKAGTVFRLYGLVKA